MRLEEYQKMVNEGSLKRFKVYVSGQSEPLILLGKNEKDVKHIAHQMIQNSSVKIRKVVKEIAVPIKKDKEGKMAKYDAKEACQDAQDVFNMIDEYDDLPEWLEAKITKASDYLNSVKDYLTHHHSGKNEVKEDFGMSARQLPSFSSKEAKNIIDGSVRGYATILRKAEAKVIKDWMSKAKAGVIDYFDIVRGLQTGDASRAHPFEIRFLKAILDRDKIMNRFRSYFGGKKGKPGYRGPK